MGTAAKVLARATGSIRATHSASALTATAGEED